MVILINHQPAVLKKGTSFDFIAENYMFTGADSYSLSITFPIQGCAQNIAIFGYLYRKDFDISETVLDCEIHEKGFHKYGAVSIVEIDEIEVKVQFLEGRSKMNFYSSFDDVYINEIAMPSVQIVPGNKTPMDLMHNYDEQNTGTYYGYVVLPWVNNTSGNIQNKIRYVSGGAIAFEWEDANTAVVGFPFLLEVLEQVFSGVGYSYDFDAIINSQWKDCIICNALPVPWDIPEMNMALPHWTVTEFIEHIEKLLDGYIDVDEVKKKVTFRFRSEILDGQGIVELANVVDSIAVEVNEEEESENSYIEQRGLAYQDGGHHMMKYYDCPWTVEQIGIIEWNTYGDMCDALAPFTEHKVTDKYSNDYYKKIHYCRDLDTYFALKFQKLISRVEQGVTQYYEDLYVLPINMFRAYVPDGGNADDSDTVSIVPVCLDWTDDNNGNMAFLECGSYGEGDGTDDNYETSVINTIVAGEKEKKSEYFNMMYVAFWDGIYSRFLGAMPHPVVDVVDVVSTFPTIINGYNMRLVRDGNTSRESVRNRLDQTKKYTFKFLADDIPNVTEIFLIQGKKYLAEKITATFSAETGMSQLLKMDAYRIEDD